MKTDWYGILNAILLDSKPFSNVNVEIQTGSSRKCGMLWNRVKQKIYLNKKKSELLGVWRVKRVWKSAKPKNDVKFEQQYLMK